MKRPAILRLLSDKECRRGGWIVAGVFLRALLDFVGVAALLSVLLLLLSDEVYREYAWMMAVAGVGFMVLKNALTVWLDRCQSRYLLSLYKGLSARMLRTHYRNGLLFVRETGVSALTHEVNYVCYSFVLQVLAPLLRMAGESVVLLLLAVALTVYSPFLMLLLAACFIPAGWIYKKLMRSRLEAYGNRENQAKRSQWQIVQELFRGYAEVETNQAYEILCRRFDAGLDEISHNRERVETMQRLPAALMETAMALALLMLVLIGGEGDKLTATLGVFGVAAFRILPGVRSWLGGWMQLRNNTYTVDILTTALSETENTKEAVAEPLRFTRELRAEHLSFAYNEASGAVIEDFSLCIRPGERVGIQGASGIGKSTLFNLLLGFFPADSGKIYIDDVLLTPANRPAWHRLVGYVPQEVFILGGTVAENIALGQAPGTADRERLLAVLEQVRLTEWLHSLPDGLDTPLGESGCRLSGGQRQRIGIARALYKGAEILFFDEATSALDRQTEEEVIQLLGDLSTTHRKWTLLMIAHRESSLRICNRIITL